MLLLLPLMAAAQQPLRVEIEAKSTSDDYYVVPVGSEGVLLFNETNESAGKGKKNYMFTKYDTNFKEEWSKQFPVRKELSYIGFDISGKNVHVLLSESRPKGDFQVIKVNFDNGEISSVSGKVPNKATVSDFKVVGEDAYFGGHTLPTTIQTCGKALFLYATCLIPACFGAGEIKQKPVLIHTDLSTGKVSPFVYKLKGSSQVSDINKDEGSSNASVVVINRPKKNMFSLAVQEFTNGGSLESTITINPRGKNELLNGRVMTLNNKDKLLIGTYSQPASKKTLGEKIARAMAKTTSPTYSNGLYISKIGKDGDQEFIQYHPFSSFEKFWDYLRPKTAKRAKNRAKKREAEGRSSEMNYNLLVHDIIEKNDEYIMVAEAYYPEYHYESRTTVGANGQTQTTYVRVFDGFRYTHAIIAGFNKEGDLLWDNSFEIWDILSFHLKERVKVLADGEDIVLAYSNGGAIKSKVIRGREVLDGKSSTPIETNYTDDKVRQNYNSDMAFWYDNYFITWGYQKIKNTNKEVRKEKGKRKRTVFYFNKIAFQ